MDSKLSFDLNPLLLVGVGLAVGLSIAALALSLSRLRGVVLERRPRWPQARWIVVPVFGSALLGIGMVWLLYRPEYEATATVRIAPTSERIVFDVGRLHQPYEVFVNTECSIMTGPTVVDRVLDRADVRGTQWYRDSLITGGESSAGEFHELFTQRLHAAKRPETELIDISVTAAKPSDARLLADAVITEYKKLRGDQDKQSDNQVKEILTTEQASLQMEIDGLIKTRFNISGRLGTDSPQQLRSLLSQRMNQLEDSIHEKQRQQEMKRWELDYMRQVGSQPSGGGNNPPLALVTADRERLAREVDLLQKDLDLQRRKVAEAGDVALEIASYDERIRQKRELYEAVRSRREQIDMEEKAPARVRVVAYASEPTRPRHDRRPGTTLAILAAAACLSLLLLAVRPSDGRSTPPPGITPPQS